MGFKKLDIEDRDVIQKFVGKYTFNTYEYTFLTLYIWRKMFNIEYDIIDNTLIIKKNSARTGSYFMQPVGYKKENLKDIILELNNMRKNDDSFNSLLRDIETPFLSELIDIFNGDVKYSEDVNNFDYIYNSQDLIRLSGKKFHRKKNQYNQFISSYEYELKDLGEPGVVDDCIRFARTWFEERGENDRILLYELEGIEDALPKHDLLGIKGMAVYIGGRIAGFTAGEKLDNDMAVIHFEKSDLAYDGIYSCINKTFVEKYLSDVKYVNRQEDLGIKGLRKAKMAYNPVKLEKKFIVDLLC